MQCNEMQFIKAQLNELQFRETQCNTMNSLHWHHFYNLTNYVHCTRYVARKTFFQATAYLNKS